MKKGLSFLVVFLLVVGAACVHAQGLPGFGFPGMPMFPGGPAGAYDSGRPFLTPPIFYIGWMETYRNAHFQFDGTNLGSVVGVRHRWPVAGLWLGLEEKINVGTNCEVDLDGWVLIPVDRRSAEAEDTTTPVVNSLGQVVGLTTNQGGRTWNARPDWWYLDAIGGCGCSKTFKVLGGFRYEHFSMRFNDPQDPVAIAITGQDRADFTVNSYQPLVGVEYNQGGGSTGKISIKVLGFPYVPADVTFAQTATGGTTRIESKGNFKDSYFFEIFAQAERSLFGDAHIGAFLRWNWLHGRVRLDSELLPAAVITSEDRASFDRNTVTIGGSFSLYFAGLF